MGRLFVDGLAARNIQHTQKKKGLGGRVKKPQLFVSVADGWSLQQRRNLRHCGASAMGCGNPDARSLAHTLEVIIT